MEHIQYSPIALSQHTSLQRGSLRNECALSTENSPYHKTKQLLGAFMPQFLSHAHTQIHTH